MNKRLFLLPLCMMLMASCTTPKEDPKPKGNDGLTPETAFTGTEAVDLAVNKLKLKDNEESNREYYIKGVVASVKEIQPTPTSTYGNATFDLDGGFKCYRIKKLAADGSFTEITTDDTEMCQIQAGDTVCVYGKIMVYGETIETPANKAGIVSVTYGPDHVLPPDPTQEPDMVTGMSLAQIVADTRADFAVKYSVSAKITAWNTNKTDATGYGNWFMSDDEGANTVLVYGATEDATKLAWDGTKYVYTSGSTNFDPTRVAIGDTVDMQVVRTEYKGTKQVQGVVTAITKGEGGGGEDVPPTPTYIEKNVAGALEVIEALADNGVTTEVYKVTGFITSVKYTWTSDNGISFYINDSAEDTEGLYIFKYKCAEAAAAALVAGVQVEVIATLQKYKNNNTGVITPETKTITSVTVVGGGEDVPPVVETISVAEALNIAAALDGNAKEKTTTKYTIEGYCVEFVKKGTSGDAQFKIADSADETDASKILLVFYATPLVADQMPAAGDQVTVEGLLQNFQGTLEVSSGAKIVALVPANA